MKNVIGIDIGGTKMQGIVWDGKNIVEELVIATPKNLFEFQRNLLKLADFLSAKHKIAGVGIGMAGQIDGHKGIAVHSPNIRYIKNLNFINLFKEHGFKNVKLDNDNSCFTRAELKVGQGRLFDNFLAIGLGTGIGGGIVISKKLYRGRDNSGAELGHVTIGTGSFEQDYQKLRDKKDYKGAGVLIGKALASYVNIFAPDAIIIGGGFGHNESKKYLPSALKTMRQFMFNQNSEVKILITKLKHPGAIGAALLT